MEKPQNKKLLAFFLLTLLLVIQSFFYENDTCSPCNSVCFQDISYIGLDHQPDIPDIPELYSNSFLYENHDKDLSIYVLQHILKEEFNYLEPWEIWQNVILSAIQSDLPSSHIISILQRKNHWHQSSDDDPLPHIFS